MKKLIIFLTFNLIFSISMFAQKLESGNYKVKSDAVNFNTITVTTNSITIFKNDENLGSYTVESVNKEGVVSLTKEEGNDDSKTYYYSIKSNNNNEIKVSYWTEGTDHINLILIKE